ncbi:MAG TPA: dienelactone hydrolase family protein [Polyangiaceae bacterium]|nr:dienelactone hydrolase family protein [Polyangiaceae bacterium]
MKRLLLMAMLLLGCKEDEPAPTPPPPPPSVATTTASVSSAPIGLLTEEEFKALHVLKTDKPPPRRGSDVKLASSRAYLSLPAAEPPLIGLLVIHEWWGLNEHIMHWSDRLAADGYAAVAVDLYDGKVATDPDEAMKLMKAVDDKKAISVLKEAVAFLGSDERIRAKRRGAIGWCFGGKWALEAALAAPELDAVVVYYGHVTTDAQRLAGLQASLLGIFGTKDKGIPPEHVDRFEFALEQAGGKDYKILRYDADHAFANPSNARYDEKAAAEAWQEVRAFLKRRLKEGKPE